MNGPDIGDTDEWVDIGDDEGWEGLALPFDGGWGQVLLWPGEPVEMPWDEAGGVKSKR